MIKCTACNGKGKHWHAYNFDMKIEVECTEETWHLLPESEDAAVAHRGHYVRGKVDVCAVCNGKGEVKK